MLSSFANNELKETFVQLLKYILAMKIDGYLVFDVLRFDDVGMYIFAKGKCVVEGDLYEV